jgi:hypothetical protein
MVDEETPDSVIGVEIVAGFANDFFDEVLFAAGPGVAAAIDAVEGDLGPLLAVVVGIDFGFHAAFFL